MTLWICFKALLRVICYHNRVDVLLAVIQLLPSLLFNVSGRKYPEFASQDCQNVTLSIHQSASSAVKWVEAQLAIWQKI